MQTLQDEKALGRLVALGLLEEQTDGALLMHRLVTEFAREASSDATAQPSVEQALLGTVGDLLNAGYPEPLVALLPHLRACLVKARVGIVFVWTLTCMRASNFGREGTEKVSPLPPLLGRLFILFEAGWQVGMNLTKHALQRISVWLTHIS